jgi:hypothetical protein
VAEKTEFDLAATAAVGAVIPPEPFDPADELVLVPDTAPPPPGTLGDMDEGERPPASP